MMLCRVSGWGLRRCRRLARCESTALVKEWPKPDSPEGLALRGRPAPVEGQLPPAQAMGYKGTTTTRGSSTVVPQQKKDPASVTQNTEASARPREPPPPPPNVVSQQEDRRPPEGGHHHHQQDPKTSSTQQHAAPPPPQAVSEGAKRLLEFRMTPREVKAALDERVVGQTEAKKALAVTIAQHYHHARRCLEDPALFERQFHKQNVLLFGPSGTGKTALLRAAAEIAHAPMVKADSTKFSATGYVGRDVSDVLTQLIETANDDLVAAQFGLVYVDEIDKVCEKTSFSGGGGTVNTRDVQGALLRLMEDYEMPLPNATPIALNRAKKDRPKTFSTKHVLFVFAGAFEDRTRGRRVPALASADDFVRAGLLPEFVGRCPVRVGLNDLSVNALTQILLRDSDVSPLARYVDAFANHGIAFTYDRDALDLLARRAHAHGLGARGLLTEVEATLRAFSYHLPCCAQFGLQSFHLDRATVADPSIALHRILDDFGGPHHHLDDDDDDDDPDLASSHHDFDHHRTPLPPVSGGHGLLQEDHHHGGSSPGLNQATTT